MMHIKKLILLVGIIGISTVHSQNQVNDNFETFSFPAQIYDSQIVNAELSSCLDKNKVTHIAWIKNDGTLRYLMYTKFNPITKQFTTTQLEAGSTSVKIAPKIITDANNNPHIVYIMKRDPNVGISNGNYAVVYVGDEDGDGVFEILQVSTNPINPTSSVNNIYNCYVNDRPSIMLIGSDIYITYISESSSVNSYNNYLILAKKNGSSWIYSQEFKINSSTIGGTYSADAGISFPSVSQNLNYGGLIEISNYNPIILCKSNSWNVVQIPGYSGAIGTNKHVSIVVDNSQKTHFLWYNTLNKKFCHTILTNNNFGLIDEYSVLTTSTGNLFPSTVDISTGLPVYFYNTLSGKAKIIIGTKEIEIKNIGVSYGKDAIQANDGYISMTSASESNQMIYVTTNTGISSAIKEINIPKINIYPNPSDFNIQITGIKETAQISIINSEGKTLITKQLVEDQPVSVQNLINGIYLIRIQTSQGMIERKLIKK